MGESKNRWILCVCVALLSMSLGSPAFAEEQQLTELELDSQESLLETPSTTTDQNLFKRLARYFGDQVCEVRTARSLVGGGHIDRVHFDKTKHCYVSCLVHAECGSALSMGLMGMLKELADPFQGRCGELEDQWANLMGIAVSEAYRTSPQSFAYSAVDTCKQECLRVYPDRAVLDPCPSPGEQLEKLLQLLEFPAELR